jgi:hypothetical protein
MVAFYKDVSLDGLFLNEEGRMKKAETAYHGYDSFLTFLHSSFLILHFPFHGTTADTSALGKLSPASFTAVIWILAVLAPGRPVSVTAVSLVVATLR